MSTDSLRIDAYVGHLLAHDRSKRTLQEYRADLESLATWFEQTHGHPPTPEAVTPLDIREWKNAMDVRGWTPSTVNRRLCAARSFFTWARNQGLVPSNPTDGIRDKRVSQYAPAALERAQVRKLRDAAQDRILIADGRRTPTNMTASSVEARRDKAILIMFLATGLRLSELCDLHMHDLCLGVRSGELIVRAGKGNKWRQIPLNIDVRKALYEWLSVRPPNDEERLFVGRRGAPLRPRAVQRILSRLALKAGLCTSLVSPHILRHTFAKSLIDADEPLTKVQALLGHETVVTTSRYTKPSKEDLDAAVERISWDEKEPSRI